jgi:hypothetical protein
MAMLSAASSLFATIFVTNGVLTFINDDYLKSVVPASLQTWSNTIVDSVKQTIYFTVVT